MRFCPVSETMSASVPSATRSSTCRMSMRLPDMASSLPLRAAMRKKATPTPARCGQGLSSLRRGLVIAWAGGSSSGGMW